MSLEDSSRHCDVLKVLTLDGLVALQWIDDGLGTGNKMKLPWVIWLMVKRWRLWIESFLLKDLWKFFKSVTESPSGLPLSHTRQSWQQHPALPCDGREACFKLWADALHPPKLDTIWICFLTFLHLHLCSHVLTIRISLIIFHGFHRDCQNCACGNILFNRSSLFWFSTFNFLPELLEQALDDDSALPKTKTVMYIQQRKKFYWRKEHRLNGLNGSTLKSETGWHPHLPLFAPCHGRPRHLLPKWRCAWSWSRSKKSRRIVSSRQIASTSLKE